MAAVVRRHAGPGAAHVVLRGAGTAGGLGRGGGAAHRARHAAGGDAGRRARIRTSTSCCPPTSIPRSTTCACATRAEFEDAVRDALAALPDRDRLLLRLTAVSGLSHEQIANIYKVNQSTVSRWIARARAEVLEATERNVCRKLGVKRDEFMSLAGLLVSRIDLSISRVLETSTDE